jgi:hypothetical protein
MFESSHGFNLHVYGAGSERFGADEASPMEKVTGVHILPITKMAPFAHVFAALALSVLVAAHSCESASTCSNEEFVRAVARPMLAAARPRMYDVASTSVFDDAFVDLVSMIYTPNAAEVDALTYLWSVLAANNSESVVDDVQRALRSVRRSTDAATPERDAFDAMVVKTMLTGYVPDRNEVRVIRRIMEHLELN